MLRQKGLGNIVITLIIFLGILVGLALIKNPQIFSPKASVPLPLVPETSLTLFSSQKEYYAGNEFTVEVLARSDIDEASEVKTEISYPSDKIEILTIKTSEEVSLLKKIIGQASAQERGQFCGYESLENFKKNVAYYCPLNQWCLTKYLSISCIDDESCFRLQPKGICGIPQQETPAPSSNYYCGSPACQELARSGQGTQGYPCGCDQQMVPSPTSTQPGPSISIFACSGAACSDPNDPRCQCSPGPIPSPEVEKEIKNYFLKDVSAEAAPGSSIIRISGKARDDIKFKTSIKYPAPLMAKIKFRAIKSGEAELTLTENSQILRKFDNSNILNFRRNLSLVIKSPQGGSNQASPSADQTSHIEPNLKELSFLLSNFNKEQSVQNSRIDLNQDGIINLFDLLKFLQLFGR